MQCKISHDCQGVFTLTLSTEITGDAEERRFLKRISMGDYKISGFVDAKTGLKPKELTSVGIVLRLKSPLQGDDEE